MQPAAKKHINVIIFFKRTIFLFFENIALLRYSSAAREIFKEDSSKQLGRINKTAFSKISGSKAKVI